MKQHPFGKFIVAIRQFAVFLITVAIAGETFANPVLENVAAGQAVVEQTPGSTIINQSSSKAILNWQSFNIGAGEKTHFQQLVNGIALNRINPSQGASQIYGQLTATGKIILVNQAGIYFGPSARVDVAGLIASTSDISDENFLAGKYQFNIPSSQNGSIINQGSIYAAKNGLVALIGTGVRNDGTIQARAGSIVLASGNKFTLDLSGDGLVNFTVDEAISSAGVDQNGKKLRDGVKNTGALVADGGTIIVSARTARNVVDNAINMRGVAQARSVSRRNGVIILDGGDGAVQVSGRLDVSGRRAGSHGGTVKILARTIHVKSKTIIDASGDAGGGEVLIGGNYQGKGPEQNAYSTEVDNGVKINANALTTGNGGKVIVWSDHDTQFSGAITAMGGINGGNGGFVETSGHTLNVNGATVNLLAPAGKTGTWLLDPTNLTISTGSTSGVNTSGNTFTGDANTTSSTLNVTQLTNALATANIIVQTTAGGSGSGAGDIIVGTPIAWSSPTTLELSAYRNIQLNNSITNTTAANIILRADNTGTGTGTVTGSGVITTASGGTVTIFYNPSSYTSPTNFSANVSGATLTAYMLVNNVNQLQNMNQNVRGSYALSQNIDASATSGWNGGAGFVPIDGTFHFSGKFNGQNYTITNLFINRPSQQNVGLFAAIQGTGGSHVPISNVGLINPTITGGSLVGGVAGTSTFADFQNIYVSGGSINTAQGTVGGLVGEPIGFGSFTNVYNTSSVTSTFVFGNAGGIMGVNTESTVLNAYNLGTITGPTAGGIAGQNRGTIQNSWNQGDIIGTGSILQAAGAGGLAGDNVAIIQNSWNLGSVLSTGIEAGGIAGANEGTIQNTYNQGTVSGTDQYTGGIVGYNDFGSIDSSYNLASVTGSLLVGGVAGQNDGSVSNTYNQGSVAGAGLVGGVVGYNTLSLQDSWNQGSVSSTGAQTGGVAGANDGSISRTFNQGAVFSTDIDTGGVVGSNGSGTLQDSYNLAPVTGTVNVGGVVGLNQNSVDSTYSTGYMTGTASLGGAIGFNDIGGAVTSTYWDTQTSGLLLSDGGTPQLTSELQADIPAGFSPTTWNIINTLSYPYLTTLYTTTPRAVSGFAPGGSSDASGLANSNVQIAVNGTNLVINALETGSVTTGNNGYYYFLEPTGAIADQGALIAYLVSGGAANAVTLAPTSDSLSGLNMSANSLTVGDGSTQTLTNTNALLAQAINGLSSNILYSTSGTTNLNLNTDVSLISSNTTTYNLDGNITASGNGNVTFGGPLSVSSGSRVVTVANGDITFNGTLSGGTLTLNGPSIFNASVNGLSALTVNGPATINTNTMSTTGSQYYNDVTLGSPVVMTSDASNITLAGVLTGGSQSLTLTGGTGGNHQFALTDVASIGSLTITGNNAVSNTIDFSQYVVPIVLKLSAPTTSQVLDSGLLQTKTSVPIGSFSQINTAIGTLNDQSVLILPSNVPNLSVTYTNAAHTSGIIADPFFFIHFIIQQESTPPSPNPLNGIDRNTFISGTTAYIVNNRHMEILVDGINNFNDYFASEPAINANINELIAEQNALTAEAYLRTPYDCYFLNYEKDIGLKEKDCRFVWDGMMAGKNHN